MAERLVYQPQDPRGVEEWSNDIEKLLAIWIDTTLCYKDIYEASHRKFKVYKMFIEIPCIVLSSVNSMLSFSSTKIFGNNGYADITIGAISTLTALLATLLSYTKWNDLSVNFLESSIGFNRLHRLIVFELNLTRDKRKPAREFLEMCVIEYNRLCEMSKLPPQEIIDEFLKKNGEIRSLKIPSDILLRHTKIRDIDTDSMASSVNEENLTILVEKQPETRPFQGPEANLRLDTPKTLDVYKSI